MSNMSYCMFENTVADLNACVSTMEMSFSFQEMELSTGEVRAYQRMRELCEQFLVLDEQFHCCSASNSQE